jgi:hypothetical protein
MLKHLKSLVNHFKSTLKINKLSLTNSTILVLVLFKIVALNALHVKELVLTVRLALLIKFAKK